MVRTSQRRSPRQWAFQPSGPRFRNPPVSGVVPRRLEFFPWAYPTVLKVNFVFQGLRMKFNQRLVIKTKIMFFSPELLAETALKYNIVAPMGENLESIFTAIRDFPTEKVYLISKGKHLDRIDELKSVADRLKIDVQVIEIKGSLLEGMFKTFAQIKTAVNDDSMLVDVSSGDNLDNCAALSAAYVNGLKAFAVIESKLMMLPVLKFSYYRLIPERKLATVMFLKTQPDCCSSLEDLAQRTK